MTMSAELATYTPYKRNLARQHPLPAIVLLYAKRVCCNVQVFTHFFKGIKDATTLA